MSWVNTAYPFAAAYLLAAGRIDWLLVVGTIFFLVPYNLAMYGINDVFDYESDLLNPRKGGAEGAVVDRARHRAILQRLRRRHRPVRRGAWWPAGSGASNLVLAGSLVAVYAYSAPGLRFKERPFLDSLTSSTHFVSPAVYGAGAGRARSSRRSCGRCWPPSSSGAWPATPSARCRTWSRTGEAGLGSIATVLGARRTVLLSAAAYAAAGAADAGHRLARPAGGAAGPAVPGQRAAASPGLTTPDRPPRTPAGSASSG